MAKVSVGARFRRALNDLLRSANNAKPGALAATVNEAVRPLGVDVTVFLADYEQRALRPLPEPAKPLSQPTPIVGTIAGRAYTTITTQVGGTDPDRLWVPITNSTARLGVLKVCLPDSLDSADQDVREGCRALANLVGQLLQSNAAHGDVLEAVRRTRPMSHASELLWRMLPPLTFACEEMVLAAVIEPCYEVGGDAFDYTVDATVASLAVLDAVGHGLRAGLACAVTLAAMRSARREGQGLGGVAHAADAAITAGWTDVPFVTAVLAELDLERGHLRYINAGHPPPVLLRHGRAVRTLTGGRRLPLGFADPGARIATEALEPGDRVLFYTDGVTEARDDHDAQFGLPRLVELAERLAGSQLPTAEVARRLSHAVLEHQRGQRQDDTTLLLIEWSRTGARKDPSCWS